jgi:hypothetical protein
MRTRSLQSSRADKGDAARMARIAGVRDTWRSSPTVGRGKHSSEQRSTVIALTNFAGL